MIVEYRAARGLYESSGLDAAGVEPYLTNTRFDLKAIAVVRPCELNTAWCCVHLHGDPTPFVVAETYDRLSSYWTCEQGR